MLYCVYVVLSTCVKIVNAVVLMKRSILKVNQEVCYVKTYNTVLFFSNFNVFYF